MRRLLVLLVILTASTLPAHSQLIPGGPSGDFRVGDHSTGVPRTEGSPGSSPAPTIMMGPDSLGFKHPDDIVKGIDKDLGRSTLDRSEHSSPSFNLEKDLRSHTEHPDSLK
jgi:hypothetical protein